VRFSVFEMCYASSYVLCIFSTFVSTVFSDTSLCQGLSSGDYLLLTLNLFHFGGC